MSYFIDRFLGEVFTGGFSMPTGAGGAGVFSINASSGSTIRKALLFAGQAGTSNPSIIVDLNGIPYTFDNTTIASTLFDTGYGANSKVHALDITADISASTNSYTITVPSQPNPVFQRFLGFYLLLEFDNALMNVTDVVIDFNTLNMTSNNHTYNLNFTEPINNVSDVGVSLFTDYICNNSGDSETIKVNGTTLGTIGSTVGDGNCGGAGYKSPRGNFSYANGILTALDDCSYNQAMSGLDALSNIKGLLSNNATFFSLQFNGSTTPNGSNILWMIVTVYHDTNTYPYQCQAPTINAINITNSAARITWSINNGINNVNYRVNGNPTWTTVSASGVLLKDISGLVSGTTYDYQVVSINQGGAVCAPSIIKQFTTL